MRVSWWSLALLLVLPSPAPAQQSADSVHAALAREVLTVTQVAEQSVIVMENAVAGQRELNPEVPAQYWDRFIARARARSGELVDLLVPVYTSLFPAEDLRAMLVFYRTPAGERLIAAQARLVQASMEAGEEWGMKLGSEIVKEMTEEQEAVQ